LFPLVVIILSLAIFGGVFYIINKKRNNSADEYNYTQNVETVSGRPKKVIQLNEIRATFKEFAPLVIGVIVCIPFVYCAINRPSDMESDEYHLIVSGAIMSVFICFGLIAGLIKTLKGIEKNKCSIYIVKPIDVVVGEQVGESKAYFRHPTNYMEVSKVISKRRALSSDRMNDEYYFIIYSNATYEIYPSYEYTLSPQDKKYVKNIAGYT
jgi:hypothetical protein